MVDIKIQLPATFFEEEERWGFKITKKRKELWAVQLDLLCELDRVCKKLEVRYFLSYGTLLGAVRDGHFIPWDDDIDVVMLREDYDRFLQYAPDEFIQPVFLQNAYTDEDYRRGFSQLRRSDTTFILQREIRKMLPFNQGICIDIFPLDGIAPENELLQHFEEKQRVRKQIGNIARSAEHDPAEVRDLFCQYEQISRRYRDSEYVGAVMFRPNIAKLDHLLRAWYEQTTEIDFEGMTFPVPVKYHEVLAELYGPQYMTPARVPSEHGDIIWDTDVPYPEMIKELETIVYRESDRDTAYWNSYYKNHICPMQPSAFAQYVAELIRPGKNLLELGCGNGRDSVFFSERGVHVTALDLSKEAITELRKMNLPNVEFQCDDFVNSQLYQKNLYDYVYSRFTIHSITLEQECILLKNIFGSLHSGGKFFIEVRGVNDPLFGKGHFVERNAFYYNSHYRRFIVLAELKESLLHNGFQVEYAEEQTGFAPYGDDDPPVIRIIASKA